MKKAITAMLLSLALAVTVNFLPTSSGNIPTQNVPSKILPYVVDPGY